MIAFWNQANEWLAQSKHRQNLLAILFLTALWAAYLWRIFTPNAVDQASLIPGDFSGQFYAFGKYQAERMLAGQIPLWNPYNYGGHPFLADTQSAVFYPARLIHVGISAFTGWTYFGIQMEALAHLLLASWMMYAFVRTTTGSAVSGVISAVTISYGGYLTGYPVLQMAVIEAGVWFPLALLGVYKSIRDGSLFAGWLALSGLVMGISLLAGHPQTSLFFMYGLMAYTTYRCWSERIKWFPALIVVGIPVGLGFGLAAVQVLPGLEYSTLVARAQGGYDWGGGGFPWWDLSSFLFPNVVSGWSPLYSGVATLLLAGLAIWTRQRDAHFWGIVALIGLLISLGASTIVYDLLYNFLPGISLFRGQERAAYLIAYALAILAGLGYQAFTGSGIDHARIRRLLTILLGVLGFVAVQALVLQLVMPSDDLYRWAQTTFYTAFVSGLLWLLLRRPLAAPTAALTLIVIIVFDLFSATMGTNFEAVPTSERVFTNELIETALDDDSLYRVDGWLGLGGNYGTLFGLQDIRGVSPLEPESLHRYVETLPQYRLHQLLGVRYVFTDWEQLEVPSEIVAQIVVPWPVRLHRIQTPYPRAWIAHQVVVAEGDAALGWLADPGFDPFAMVVMDNDPGLDVSSENATSDRVIIAQYQPEQIVIETESNQAGVLVLSEWYYPGWEATVDGVAVPIKRVNVEQRGVFLPAGAHTVTFVFRPLTYRIGVITSLVAAGLMITLIVLAGLRGPMAVPSKGETDAVLGRD